jgi:hypothetical protein
LEEVLMATWGQFSGEAPDLAKKVRTRFESDRHALIATLRKDGSPRISGVEPDIADGELWIGMMVGSAKSRDLQRDGRFALHNATTAAGMSSGDAKISGRAEFVTDEDVIGAYLRKLLERTGWQPPNGVDLFRAEPAEAVTISVEGDEMVIESWREGEGVRRRART